MHIGIPRGPMLRLVAKSGSLTDEENDRIRAAIRHLMRVEGLDGAQVAALLSKHGRKVDQSLVSRFISGKSGTSLEVARQVARANGMSVWELLGDGAPGTKLRDLPSWPAALTEARSRNPHIPAAAWEAAGRYVPPEPPEFIDASAVTAHASAWMLTRRPPALSEFDRKREEKLEADTSALEEELSGKGRTKRALPRASGR